MFNFGGAPATTSSSSGFSFGGTPAATASATFGSPAPTATTSATTGFGIGATPSSSTGFSFGATPAAGTAAINPAMSSAAPAGFGLGQTPVAGSAGGFGFGGTPAAAPTLSSTPGFALPGAKTTATTGFALGGATAIPASGFTLGGTPGTAATTSTAVAFGAPTAGSTTTGFNLGGTPASSTPAGISFGAMATPAAATSAAQSSLLGGNQVKTTANAPSLGLGSGLTPASTGLAATSAPTTALGLGAGFKLGSVATATSTTPATSTAATGFSLGGTAGSLGGTAGAFGKTGVQATVTAVTTSSSSVAVPGVAAAGGATGGVKQMNYRQLEDQINKWMTELEEQERSFLQQATQVNAWDRMLVENGEKITQLNGDTERVRVDQQKLEQELNFIKAQQRELEELLVPMETSLEQLPSASFQPHADLERENTYQLADNIDAQLKRMLQDLKEIIDHLNTSNSQQDANDPVLQITKILNAHMDSLQWIDTNTALLSRRVEDVSKQMETQRRDQERNFRLVYD